MVTGKASLTLILCLASTMATSKVYKWVDEDGRVHFGDREQETVEAEVEVVNIRDRFAVKHVPVKEGIRWDGEGASRTLSVSGLEVKLRHTETEDARIGGVVCGVSQDIYWEDGYVDVVYRGHGDAIVDAAANLGYLSENAMGSMPSPGALLIRGRILDIEMSICPTRRKDYFKNATWIEIEWEISDPLGALPTRTFLSEGSHDASSRAAVEHGVVKSVQAAINAAARNLFAEQQFVDMLAPVDVANLPRNDEYLRLPMVYGDGSGSFQGDVVGIKDASVVVKTDDGHGSGVVVTADGYVLTNAHVTGNERYLNVKTSRRNYPAVVVRTNVYRDVALVKIENYNEKDYVKLAPQSAGIGSLLYVIGTPLDEAFSQTITSGVLSAKREINGAPYYQTDASINRGNSGGPVFNEKGELVALTVAGHFSRDGANLGINYLIPIEDALRGLSLGANTDLPAVRDVVSSIKSEQVKGTVHMVLDWLNKPVFSGWQ